MGWQDFIEKLKKKKSSLIDIGNLRQLLRDININIFSNNTTEIHHHHYDESNKTLQINAAKLSPEERQNLKDVFHSAIDAEYTIIETKAKDMMKEVKDEEKESSAQKILKFFKDKVSLEDLEIIRGALYIRRRFNRGEKVDGLKTDIRQKYGQRGNNIVNLCTAGYFEDWLMPAYEHMQREAKGVDETLEEFKEIFDRMVSELPFTVFVCQKMKEEEVRKVILEKLEKNRKYGIKFLNIHGIGDHNIGTIYKTIAEVKSTHKAKESIKQDKKIIFARLEFEK